MIHAIGSAATARLFSSGTQNLSRDLVKPSAAATVATRAPAAALTAPAKVITPAPPIARPVLATPAALAPVEHITPSSSPAIAPASHPAEEGVSYAVTNFTPAVAAAAAQLSPYAPSSSPAPSGGLRVLPGLATLFGGGGGDDAAAADTSGAAYGSGASGSGPYDRGASSLEKSSVGISAEAPDYVWYAALGAAVIVGGVLLYKRGRRGRR